VATPDAGVAHVAQFGLASNVKTRHRIAEYFKDNFESLQKRFGDSYGISYRESSVRGLGMVCSPVCSHQGRVQLAQQLR
jgi:hypothetical protein